MFRVVSKEQKKFDTNSEPLLEVIWKEILYLKNTQRTNRYARSTNMMVSQVGIKIACLVSQLTIIKIVSNLKNNRSFLIKFRLYNIRLAKLLYISIKARLEISVVNKFQYFVLTKISSKNVIMVILENIYTEITSRLLGTDQLLNQLC